MPHGLPSIAESVAPSPRAALQQLGRWWAAMVRAPGGSQELVFREDHETGDHGIALASIFADELPPLSFRAPASAGITLAGVQVPSGYDPTTTIFAGVECRASTRASAESLAASLVRVVRPGNLPFFMPPIIHAGSSDLSGMIGTPPPEQLLDGQSAGVWRVLSMSITQDVTPSAVESSERGTAEGQGAAECTIAMTVTPAVLAAPLPSIRIWHTGDGGITRAEARVCPGVRVIDGVTRTAPVCLQLRKSVDGVNWTTSELGVDGQTMQDLIDTIGASNGWEAELVPGAAALLSRSALDLEFRPWAPALGPTNKLALRVWA